MFGKQGKKISNLNFSKKFVIIYLEKRKKRFPVSGERAFSNAFSFVRYKENYCLMAERIIKMKYCKALPSCKEKILTWKKEDFSTFAASMSNEEIRSMARELLDSCYFPSFAEDHPDAIVLDYIYLLAYEAELANNHEEAAKLYEIFEIF